MTAPSHVFQFWIHLQPDLGVRLGSWNDRGIYNPKFSSPGAIMRGEYPDNGLVEGKIPRLIHGERLDSDVAAKLDHPLRFAGMGKKQDNYPEDLLQRSDGATSISFVSGRFKRAVEALEPGVHQFITTTAANFATGDALWANSDWYYFNILTWIGPDVLFKTEAMEHIPYQVERRERPPFKVGGQTMTGKQIVSYSPIVHKHVIRKSAFDGPLNGRHVWITSSYETDNFDKMSTEPRLYCTPEMKRNLVRHGIKAVRFMRFEVQ